jgi:hypothetical protein
MILFLAITARQQAVVQKIKNFFTKWRQLQQKIPLLEMTELHITPQIPTYPKIANDVFLLLLDGKLRSRTETLKFLKPLAPATAATPPPPAKRGRGKAAAAAAAAVVPAASVKPGAKSKGKAAAVVAPAAVAAPKSQAVLKSPVIIQTKVSPDKVPFKQTKPSAKQEKARAKKVASKPAKVPAKGKSKSVAKKKH